MGKKQEKKTAKGRLDKFYWLAKEQGFRSRAAFKLVQLNKKYALLEGARCCIDLCAAPGGWLQVASKHMPPNSLIVGVDLVPIKPIPRCITFAEDINSFRCRDQLRAELKDWKADIVLHDGAPNVGTAWVQDAYQQSELVLQSLKLAVEFLAPGGSFVTKVFRSKDYNNLLWVFNQLFGTVEATKPPSSRNVSAEIFVVCRNYKAPKRVDPKFLDPRHVFKDLDPTAAAAADGEEGAPLKGERGAIAQASVFEPEKKRKRREGYADGVRMLYSAMGARAWVESPQPIDGLGANNELTWREEGDKELLKHELTTDDIKACASDLKVLGKKDFRNLLKWRTAMRLHLGLDAPAVKPGEEVVEIVDGEDAEPIDSDAEIDEELERLNDERGKALRKERRKRNAARAKKVQKMQLQMTTPMDVGQDIVDETLVGGADDMFDLTHGPSRPRTAEDSDTDSEEEDEVLDSDAEEQRKLARLEGDLDAAYDTYRQRMSERDAKWRAKEARRLDENRDEWHGFSAPVRDGRDDAEDSDGGSSVGGYDDVVTKRKLQEETFDTDDEEDEEDDRADRAAVAAVTRKAGSASKRKARAEESDSDDDIAEPIDTSGLVASLESRGERDQRQSREAAIWFDNPLFKGVAGLIPEGDDEDSEDEVEEEEDSDEEDEDEEADSDAEMEDAESDVEVVARNVADEDMAGLDGEWRYDDEDLDEIKRKRIEAVGLNTAEALTLAQQLVNREKTKGALIDDGFKKDNFVDKSDLPTWFLDEEAKHYRANIPATKEAMNALRARQRALDARPIKKIAEAKGRKKFKAAQRLEKARKKADTLNETVDISEKEKANSISKVLARAGAKPKRKEISTVVAKGVNRGLKGRPKGVKGRYRLVDARGKKELRAEKRRNKRDGKKTTSSTSNKRRVPNGY
ncbi:FtsJ-domain-containing protein [Tilletiopsis washingtonensis]|uniref:FtsJ-domain-containing protein n=1 Tax=Tilletiopsis washingtonensis TaxID=58919 RepID=A0A316Z156_9BASI|nr:FtsJ-domain-containing protein [Tilletiopsis washingtonensis]PWN95510.1 FtsJ-domain-containing protein [Tilletiopsis washingtonensis]